MDHSCYKCGNSVEDGKAFCSQCGAPQIRVAVPEPSPESIPAGSGSAVALDREVGPISSGIPLGSLPVSWAHAVQPCALAAAVAIGLKVLGLNLLVAALSTGFLAVAFFRRRSPGILVRTGAGARLGALSGLLFFGTLTILQGLAVAVLHKGAEIRGQELDNLQQWATRYPGPGVQEVVDFVKSPDGFAVMMVASLIVGCAVLILLGSCGGALSAAILGRRDRP